MGRTTKKRVSKVERALHKFGAESIEMLAEIAREETTPQKLRADIWRWFAEMEFGKPTSKQSNASENNDETEIILEGDLEVWSR